MNDESALGRFLRSDRPLAVVILLSGIVLPGLLRYWLGQNGFDTLGTAVFVVGYGTMILLVWWVWIRPLDLVGPSGEQHGPYGSSESDDRADRE